MSLFTKLGNDIASPVDAAGNPRSVSNADMQRWLTEAERLFMALAAEQGGDLKLPNLLIRYSVTGGSANAIVATPTLPVPTTPAEALFAIQIAQDNTGPVTINGKPLRTNGGEAIASGEIKANDLLLFLDNGDHLRLLMDTGSLRNKEAAELAQTLSEISAAAAVSARSGAEAARDIAAGYASDAVSQGNVPIYATRDGLPGLAVPLGITTIRLNGIIASDDAKGGIYAYRASEPAHSGKAQDANGRWFEQITADVSIDVLKANLSIPISSVVDTGYEGGTHSNIILGSSLAGKNRSTIISADGPFQVVTWDRVDAIGNQSLKWSRFAERAVAIGSLSSPWLGSNDPIGDNHTWFNSDGAGISPSDPSWDFEGLETRNPGIRMFLRDFEDWATASTDVGRGVAIGRNAGGAHVRDRNYVYIGYRAGGGVFSGDGNVAIGMDAMFQGVRLTQSAALGQQAMRYWQDGTRNLVAGRAAAANVVRGSHSTVLGSIAGDNFTNLSDSVLIGYGAANNIAGANQSDILVIGNRNKQTLVSGRFDTSQFGVNVLPGDLQGNLHVRKADSGGASPNGNANALFIEGAGTTGLTIGTPNTAQGQILFADPEGNLQGGIIYTHSGDYLDLRAGNSNRVRITNNGIGFNGNAALAKPTGVAVTAAAIHAVLVSYGLIAA